MRMRRVLATTAVLAAAAPASAALGAGAIRDTGTAAPDLDVRTGHVAPSAAQRAEARGLGGQVAWNRFGTPSTLVRPGRALATGVQGATAVAAARAWLADHRTLFKLSSVEGLKLASDSRLARSDGHAVTLRQAPGGLPASGGGLVTIGLTRAGGAWTVVSASSTLSGDESVAGSARLSAEEGWQRAAASVGRPRTLKQIAPAASGKGVPRGWTALQVKGLSDLQQARSVAFPTVRRGYVPAYETLVLDTAGAEPQAYRVFVDARSGDVLARSSLVDNQAEPPAGSPTFSFSGELPAQDGACDVRKGPYTVTADAGVRAIDAFANADTPAQDIILRLYRGDELLVEADSLRTPERLRYEPEGGVPAGDYYAQVCEFPDDVPPVEPRTYTGTLTLDTSTPPAAYLARWRIFAANPLLASLPADPWGIPSTDVRQNWCWREGETANDCDRVIGNLASRAPWDYDVKASTPTNTTLGNNARTAESWTDPFLPAPNQFRPVSPTRDYSFPWTDAWNRSDCNPGTPYGSAFVVGQYPDVPAAVTNLFAAHNRMHDWSYLLGFTEENWNAQADNFGLTEAFRENDPVVGDAQAGAALPPPVVYGAARDNANMITLPDGSSSITNMYLWQPLAGAFYAPCVDGDFDMSVIGHEYTHMIENRMVGKGDGREGFAAGAMGEAWGDLFALEHLDELGLIPTGGENRYTVGAYATGNKVHGIRNYVANFPATGRFPQPGQYPRVNPLNFSDIGYDVPGPEVHSDGEIWVAVNFEVRRALAEKYAAQYPGGDRELQNRCALGVLPADRCPGNRRWIQLAVDSMLLMPTDPTMIDARNAMLAADELRFGGEDTPELWLAFARRGMGQGASSSTDPGREAGVESDTDPLPDFAAPGARNATVTFRAASTTAGETAPTARLYVGQYEGRVSPIADTNPRTNAPEGASANNLDATASFAPGTYEFVATAPGYGHVRFRRTFAAGSAQTVTVSLAPNLASAARGAAASGDAAPFTTPASDPPGAEILSAQQVLGRLVDDTEATDWQAAATQAGNAWSVDGRQVTVDLAGRRAQTVRRVQVSALVGPVWDPVGEADLTQNRFTALRQFEVWACDAATADCAQDAGFRRVYTSPADAFPADAPRPIAPQLQLRSFAIPATRATHLRLRVRTNQCTGAPAYQGEQDADPFNATDCDTAGPASTRFVRVAEFQAFGAASGAAAALRAR
jgi:extracellular elastinolytic metalloproteinase